jgi:hypothetical protein
MEPVFLYSTNVWLKHHISERFLGGRHRFWCSESFGGSGAGSYPGSPAPSSTPREIFLHLDGAVRGQDRGSLKIKQQRAMLTALASKFAKDGIINDETKREIIYLVKNAGFEQWRPIISVIPWPVAAGRVENVDPRRRANPLVPEYIVPGLSDSEFGTIDVRSPQIS